MTPRLILHRGWRQVENPGGPWTLMNSQRQNSNALQISFMQNQDGNKLVPEPDVEQLATKMAANFAQQLRGNVARSSIGNCRFGRYGTAVFNAPKFPYCQFWSITDGIHFITVTYICDAVPSEQEIQEASEMALSVILIEEPKKKVWWKR